MSQENEKKPLLNKVGDMNISYDQFDSFYQSVSSNLDEPSWDGRSYVSRKGFSRSVYSVVSHASVMATLTEKLSGDANSTLFMTICNILPILQGSAVFGMPFAVMVGGFAFLPAAVFLCILADITGLLMIDCLYEISPNSGHRKRVHASYLDVSCACFGAFGGMCINILNMVYLTANNVVCVVLMGQCIYDAIKSHVTLNQAQITMIFSLSLVPLLFIRRLSVIAYVSLIGVLSIIIGSLVSFIVFIQHYADWSSNYHHIPMFNAKGFPLALAILMYSTMLNCILPDVEGSMRSAKQMGSALHISYTISTLFKLLFGVFGALTFGVGTQQLVALNVSSSSTVVKYILTLTLCLYAVTNFSLMYFVFYKQIDILVEQKVSTGVEKHLLYIFVSRVLGVMLCVGIALVVPYFALVSGVIGAVIGTVLAFTLPVVCHLKLKWKQLSLVRKVFEISILSTGLLLGSAATYSSISSLADAIKQTASS